LIVIVEPQCIGFEHAKVNAGLIYTIMLAYQNEELHFFGEKSHVHAIQDILADEHVDYTSIIKWYYINVPHSKYRGWKRIIHELVWLREIRLAVNLRNVQLAYFCSITNTALLILKLFISIKIDIVTIIHGELSTLGDKPARRPWNWIISLSTVLKMPHPPNIKYLLLGESIYKSVVTYYPKFRNHFEFINIPWFMEKSNLQFNFGKLNKISFGYFGTAYRGFETFNQLASDVSPKYSKAEFTLVGHSSNISKFNNTQNIIGLSGTPLLEHEFSDRGKGITYAVGTGSYEYYSWGVNTILLHSMSFIKPGVYLCNPYIAYYFNLFGDIGYLCDDYEHLKKTILSIINDFPTTRYLNQCSSIKKARKLFDPSIISGEIKKLY